MESDSSGQNENCLACRIGRGAGGRVAGQCGWGGENLGRGLLRGRGARSLSSLVGCSAWEPTDLSD